VAFNAIDQDELRPIADDVGGERVARVYAEALLDAASERNQAEEMLEQLDSLVQDVFQASPQLEALLTSGAVSRENKEPVIRKAFEGRGSEVFLHFLLVLNQHDRLDLLRAILGAYRRLLDQRARRFHLLVRSAAPLPDDQAQNLVQAVRRITNLEPILDVKVDPDLIGGVILQVGDLLYDASVRSKLALLRKQLIERSSHEIQSGRDRFGNLG
jgi:F-type H+-transporting ATPase subunit delta